MPSTFETFITCLVCNFSTQNLISEPVAGFFFLSLFIFCRLICSNGLFSGSLYTLSITNIRWLGMITPFGGLAFIIAWLLLTIGIMKS